MIIDNTSRDQEATEKQIKAAFARHETLQLGPYVTKHEELCNLWEASRENLEKAREKLEKAQACAAETRAIKDRAEAYFEEGRRLRRQADETLAEARANSGIPTLSHCYHLVVAFVAGLLAGLKLLGQ